LATVLIKRAYLPILTLGAASIGLQYLYIKFPDLAPPNYHLRTEIVASFLMISAGYFLIKNNFEKLIPSWAPIASLALALLCYSHYPIYWAAKWLIAPFLLAFTVNHLNLTPALFRTILSFLPLRLIGIWSFSIYLWQQPLYYYGIKFGDAFELAGPILFIVSIALGALSFYFIENPTRRYLNNR
jgi:peptidoglycan/LPS O-acetylase OafA/YrhL